MRRTLLALVILVTACTTIERRDGSKVTIPSWGMMAGPAAALITCQDNVAVAMEENAKLHARIAELERQLADQKRGGANVPAG